MLECCCDVVEDLSSVVLDCSEHNCLSLLAISAAFFPRSKCFFAATAVESGIIVRKYRSCLIVGP